MEAKTFILSDESVNSYGFRLITAGCKNLAKFEKTSLKMLFNHMTEWDDDDYDGPIGKWPGLRIEGTELKAEADFDLKDEEAVKISNKVDGGYLDSASIGFRPITISEDPKLMLPGQTRGTVTEWMLIEASVVDFPANENCICCYDKDGKKVNLNDETHLERIKLSFINKPQKDQPMKLKFLAAWTALSMFLNVTFGEKETEKEVEFTQDKLKELNDELVKLGALKTEVETLKADKTKLETDLKAANEGKTDAETKLSAANEELKKYNLGGGNPKDKSDPQPEDKGNGLEEALSMDFEKEIDAKYGF